MSLRQDVRDVVAGFTDLFTTQDVIDALPGYKSGMISATFRNLIWEEGIAEKTNPFARTGIFRVVNNDESIRMNSRDAYSTSIDGKHYESMVAGCRAKKLNPGSVKEAFQNASEKAGYPVTTITFKGHTVTRSHNY